jgi:hypothetical protein
LYARSFPITSENRSSISPTLLLQTLTDHCFSSMTRPNLER